MSFSFFLVKNVLNFIAKNKRKKFIEACKNPGQVQAALKQKILSGSMKAFPTAPTTYTDYHPDEKLTHEPILFFETTSGSTGAKKKIPYNRSVLNSYQNMFLLWVHDLLFHSGIKINKGKIFISISPQIGKDSDDRKYLSWPLRLLLSPFLVSFPEDHKASTSREFLINISRDLLRAKNLEIVSIWSPTYFISILNFIETNRSEFNLPDGEILWSKVWPELKLISCWMNAGAGTSANILKKKFPTVTFQAKGLLSTEAPVTIPWIAAKGEIPLVTETYLEFLDEKGNIHALSDITEGKSYVVLISQFNGFMRYNTFDEVKVTGFYFNTPVLEFLGRIGGYSDLAGEKIAEKSVCEIFSSIEEAFIILPDTSEQLPHYLVLSSHHGQVDWDEKLSELYHYKLARSLGQLGKIRHSYVPSLRELYLEFYQSKGLTLGDIKEKHLINRPDEAREFREWIELKSPSSLLHSES